jgi:ATP-dependent DNA ligase
MAREQAQGALRIASLSRADPVSYVVFDLLYRAFEPVMARPLSARRELLRGLLEGAGGPRLVLSEGVVGAGKRTFAEMGRLGLEGLLAKRLDSSYRPGARTDAWIKVKTTQRIHCAILGYVLDESGGLRSLIVGTDDEGELRCVGKVGSGLGAEMRSRLLAELRARPRPTPLVPTAERGEWVEPGLYCTVTYLERTGDGNLRAPVFEGLVEDG